MRTRTCKEFDLMQDYYFVMDRQDVISICNYAGVDHEDITAVMAMSGDGEIIEAWASEASKPMDHSAEYYRII